MTWFNDNKMFQQILTTRRRRNRRPRILIAGLGNLVLRDDGVGVHAVRHFQEEGGREYQAVDVGCAVLDALHLFEWADKILLIDAMKAEGPPGTVYKVNALDGLEAGAVPLSLHDLSVVQALKMINNDHHPEITIIGVEPEIIDYGLDLSQTVEASLPLVLRTGQEIVREWIKEHRTT
jgi:hydrogenase maturation protease